ncbi:MAG: GntR family transcriptional regulator [Clostridioides sp.]|jgi:GntR family transcriptional repressor for pyruvate dehydrogenase complex|nr:GntR family transcriptional regulator [Clostridioides sp.]
MKSSTTKKSIPDQVFENLMEEISSGVIKPGDKIPSEHELCDIFGVSRPSIKMALDRLNLLGVLESRVGDGTYLKKFSALNFVELYSDLFGITHTLEDLVELRDTIILKSFINLCKPGEVDDKEKLITNLSSIYNEIKFSLMNIDYTPYPDLKTRFFTEICRCSTNEYFLSIYNLILKKKLIHSYELSNVNDVESNNLIIENYQLIIDAIVKEDYKIGIDSFISLIIF